MLNLLRDLPEHWGYSGRELGRGAHVGYVSIVRIEQGQMSPTVAMLEKLARALGISVRDFFPAGWPESPRRRDRG